MNGYMVTFFTQQDRRHNGKRVSECLVELCKELGLRGATIINAAQGIGHDHRVHSTHFFEQADQPMLIQMAMTEEEKREASGTGRGAASRGRGPRRKAKN